MRGKVVVLAELVHVRDLERPLAQDEGGVDLGHGLHGVGQLVVGEAHHRLQVAQEAAHARQRDVDAVVHADLGQLPKCTSALATTLEFVLPF